MRRICFVVAILLLAVILTVPAFAFDGKRKGFILGGGLGFGSTSFSQTVEFGGLKDTSPKESKGTIMTDFKIGFGASEQLEIYYSSKVAWFSILNVLDDEVTVADGVGGIGVTYHLKPAGPNYFITGGMGLATWDLPFEDPSPKTWIGFGLYIGGGYEFSKHYSFELDVVYGNPGITESGITVSASSTALMLTVNALAY